MMRSIRTSITKVANQEQLVTVETGQESKNQKVVKFGFEQLDDTIFRAYINQDRVTEVHSQIPQVDSEWVELDQELKTGDILQVGFFDEAGSATVQEVVTFIEET